MSRFSDLTNMKFGRLTVIKPVKIRTVESGYRVQIWEVQCDCGTILNVRSHGNKLKTLSCGCLQKEIAANRCSSLNLITDYKQYILNNIRLNRNGCWLWTNSMFANGYARTGIQYKIDVHKRRAYRLSYLLFKGEFNKDLVLCHTCDNPRCVNPEHLFVGTTQDNMDDMKQKGRSLVGEKHHKSKLIESDVVYIRNNVNVGICELANKFNVSDCTIRDIIKNRSWKHVKH